MIRRAIGVCVCVLSLAVPAAALEVRVKDVRVASNVVGVAVDVRDLLSDRFKRVLDDGGVLHLRVQAELWQSRPVWDRLVYPAIVHVFRLARAVSGRDLAVTDQGGAVTTYAAIPNPMPVVVELGKPDRLTAAEHYYVRVIATFGTLADREVDDVGDAVFGRPSETTGLGSLGRMVFRKIIEIGDYLQSDSAEAKSRSMPGRDILRP